MFAGIGFYRLVVDPRDGRRLIVATTGGAAVSADGGATWSLLHQGPTWDVSLAYLGDVAEILLAAPDGLFSARGGGAPVSVDVPDLQALDPDRERMAVAHVPSDPGQAFVFAANRRAKRACGIAPPRMEPTNPSSCPPSRSADYVEQRAQCRAGRSYDWHVSVPPAGRRTSSIVGAIELLKGVRGGGGWQWSDISSRIDQGDSIHPDQHTMAFDAHDPNVIYAGNDGGIFRSPDGGESWQSLNAASRSARSST